MRSLDAGACARRTTIISNKTDARAPHANLDGRAPPPLRPRALLMAGRTKNKLAPATYSPGPRPPSRRPLATRPAPRRPLCARAETGAPSSLANFGLLRARPNNRVCRRRRRLAVRSNNEIKCLVVAAVVVVVIMIGN